MKIAIVHDYLTQYGGTERILGALCEMFPRAPIYTLLYDKKKTGFAFEGREIITSFLQRIPFSRRYFRSLPLLMPLAIEQFDLSYFDVVISNTVTAFAKGVITHPHQLHICYCSTPPRFLWYDSHKNIRQYKQMEDFTFGFIVNRFIPFFISYLRIWDREAALRPDYLITNSENVRERIRKYYNRDAEVIYPPVNAEKFYISYGPKKFFLMVGRMLPHKRFDLGIEACLRMGLPLCVVGDGPERKKLELRVRNYESRNKKKANIKFLGLVSDSELPQYYTNARAVLFPQEEDFGIVSLEAMASGVPVIAYREGGALETVIEGRTGLFFDTQHVDSLISAIKKMDYTAFHPSDIRAHAIQFDKEVFKKNLRRSLEEKIKSHEPTLMKTML